MKRSSNLSHRQAMAPEVAPHGTGATTVLAAVGTPGPDVVHDHMAPADCDPR